MTAVDGWISDENLMNDDPLTTLAVSDGNIASREKERGGNYDEFFEQILVIANCRNYIVDDVLRDIHCFWQSLITSKLSTGSPVSTPRHPELLPVLVNNEMQL